MVEGLLTHTNKITLFYHIPLTSPPPCPTNRMARHRRSARRRFPRDSATNIYRTCKQAGTCPPDVINKVEGTTVADKILQYGSAGVYLGGLGIGTGTGSGGRLGYVPVGENPGVTVGTRPIPRPSVPVETVGPSDIFPVDTIRPTDPSVIDLSSAPTPTDPSLPAPEVEVIAEVHPIPPEGPVNTPTTSITTSGGDVAVMEVAPEPSPPVRARARVSKTTYHNPAFHSFSTTSTNIGEASGMESIAVLSGSGGRVIGGDGIELSIMTGRQTFDTSIYEETSFGGRSSTPIRSRGLPRPPSRRYHTYTRTPLQEILDPVRALGPDIINPVYEGAEELSIAIPEGAGGMLNSDFIGTTRLGRVFGVERGGRITIGRTGQKTSLRTRSGVAVGPRHYFFSELSSIAPLSDTVELSTLNPLDISMLEGEGTIIEGNVDGTSTMDTISLSSWSEVSWGEASDIALLDDDTPSFHGQLVIGTRRSTQQVNLPVTYRPLPEGAITVDHGDDPSFPAPASPVGPAPSDPTVVVYVGPVTGADYYLHPSLLRRRRRRRHSHL